METIIPDSFAPFIRRVLRDKFLKEQVVPTAMPLYEKLKADYTRRERLLSERIVKNCISSGKCPGNAVPLASQVQFHILIPEKHYERQRESPDIVVIGAIYLSWIKK